MSVKSTSKGLFALLVGLALGWWLSEKHLHIHCVYITIIALLIIKLVGG